jgi:hypothetical protein
VFALKMVAYVGIAPIVGGFAHRLPRISAFSERLKLRRVAPPPNGRVA